MRLVIGPMSLVLGCLLAAPARADLGALRLATDKPGGRITVFTSPAPLRAGPVEVKVLAQETDPLRVVARLGDERVEALTQVAGSFQAAWLVLPAAGEWQFEVAGADWQVGFAATVAEPIPSWRALAPWIGWPIVPIALFLVHQWLCRRERPVGQA